jgi:hypothetical protein
MHDRDAVRAKAVQICRLNVIPVEWRDRCVMVGSPDSDRTLSEVSILSAIEAVRRYRSALCKASFRV